MTFLGKWTLSQDAGRVVVNLTTGSLGVGPAPPDGSDRFNAYGTESAFTLQAANGSYVVRSGAGYAAPAASTAAPNYFSLSPSDASVQIVDLGPDPKTPGTAVWSVSNGTLSSVAQAIPAPPSTLFAQTVVTSGLEDILKNGFGSPQPDLTWVSVPGVDWTQASLLDLTQAVLTHADFSGGMFAPNTAFHKGIADHANFSNATLNRCDLSSMTLTWAQFTDAKMDGIDLSYSDLSQATGTRATIANSRNLANAVFDNASFDYAVFSGASNILKTSFNTCSLVGVSFKGSSVTGLMDLTGADLTGAYLSNPADGFEIYPNNLRFDHTTTFDSATMRHLDLTGYDLSNTNFVRADLTGCKLDRANLTMANFGFAVLDGVTVTGGVAMHGANLTSASLQGADLTGAQLGAVGQAFRVGASDPNFALLHTALLNADGPGVARVFQAEGQTLNAPVSVRPSTFTPDTAWQVSAPNLPLPYLVVLEGSSTLASLAAYQPTSPAVLSNAFMVNVNLNGANLFGVRASGVQLYSTVGKSVNLNRATVDGLQVNNANLGSVDLSQANLNGVNFDYAILTGADFTGATIGIDSNGGQTSFNGTNLQGAKFTSATLQNVIFANAACAVANPNDIDAFAGVWLFTMPARTAGLVTGQLASAVKTATAPTEMLQTMQTSGPVPAGLAAALAYGGLKVAADALLVVMTTGTYWHITDGANHYVVFESVSNDYAPALGVASGDAYTVDATCYLDLSLESSLVNGPIASAVVSALAATHITVSSDARVTVAQYPKVWQVVSGADLWTLWLRFDSTALGADTQLAMRPAIDNLIAAFGSSSIALSAQSVVTAIPSGGWLVDNDSENPFNAARGYIQFALLPTPDGGVDVYGHLMRIVRATGPNTQQFFNIPCATTQLTSKSLAGSGNTVCPNGGTVTSNTTAEVPFDQWLRARLLPSPPVCVPDPSGKFSCPN